MQQYSREEKLKIIKEYFAGKSRTELSQEYNINRRTIYRWLILYNEEGRKGLVSN